MSVQYDISLDLEIEPTILAAALARELHICFDEFGSYPGGRFPTLEADGIVAPVTRQSGLSAEILMEAYGIRTTILISCNIDKFELYHSGMNWLLRICGLLLETRDCDLVLMVNGEIAWLLRKDGRVYLDENDELWRKKWIDALIRRGISFTEKKLGSV